MKRGLFVTGTDTGIGKTLVSALLVSALRQAGRTAGYFKPVQTGSESDRDEVRRLASPRLEAPPVYALEMPAAPSRAAAAAGMALDLAAIVAAWDALPEGDWIVEGAGGLLVPIETTLTMRDLAAALRLPVLVVASTRLGTINHTLLTLEAARAAGLDVRGVVLCGEDDPGLEKVFAPFDAPPIVARLARLPEVTPGVVAAQGRAAFPPALLESLLTTGGAGPARADAGGARSGHADAGGPEAGATGLAARDEAVLWHPYTQHGLGVAPLPVAAAEGAWLRLHDGRRILDAIASWWVNLHGHGRPEIAAAIAAQARRLEQVIFAGFTHEPAVALGELLIAAARERGTALRRVFYSDNGSTAVEVALKMAFQYHLQSGASGRTRFAALRHAYHGDTFGAMAAGEPDGFHAIFRPLLAPVDFVEPGDAAALAALFGRRPGAHAALIVEPMVQGATGMRFHTAAFLEECARLCREAGVLLICDEVFTGFHRTGPLFAFEHAGLAPDLVCLSKGLTGGFLPLGATLATEELFAAFASRDRSRTFLHGHSYTANPLACAAGVASWTLLRSDACRARREAIAARTARHIAALAAHPRARHARHLGTLGAVDRDDGGGYFAAAGPRLFRRALERGVLLRPLGNVLYALPPYCVTDDEVDRIYEVMAELLDMQAED